MIILLQNLYYICHCCVIPWELKYIFDIQKTCVLPVYENVFVRFTVIKSHCPKKQNIL